MAIPNCPICGSQALDATELEHIALSDSMTTNTVGVVICHCAESHRFLALPKGPDQLPGPAMCRPVQHAADVKRHPARYAVQREGQAA
jgi:hypothetical protein